MRQKVTKAFILRQRVYNKSYTGMVLKSLQCNPQVNHYQTYKDLLISYRKNHSGPTKTHCVMTATARGLNRRYRVVRHVFKSISNAGWISGIRKSCF